jgi:DNA (cytosine-5)-methyltransferase 1
MHVVGHFANVAAASAAMGIDWMTRDELREAVPPAYARFLALAMPFALEPLL